LRAVMDCMIYRIIMEDTGIYAIRERRLDRCSRAASTDRERVRATREGNITLILRQTQDRL
jgi:hypothetical protein